MTSIRPTTEADIIQTIAMYDNSRCEMRANGNTTQWVGYPNEKQLRLDIQSGSSFIVEEDGEAVGTFALVCGVEPTYSIITHGRWIDTQTPYATIHRMARNEGKHGIAAAAFGYAKQHAHLRADTHESNKAMRCILERQGFAHCGTVFMSDGTTRMAYEWWRWDMVPPSLRQYIEQDIIPQYDHHDQAHGRGHALRVIARAMMMEPSAATYVAAAMHDIGLSDGREAHHLHSGRRIRNDLRLPQWFRPDEIEAIAQAAEDHRASADTEPRSMLGKIVAEADRDIEPQTIVRRTIEYGMSHYPDLDREGHWQRMLQHLDEKYSEHGYIKLWLDDSPNKAPLEELRLLIGDKERLREMFDTIYEPAE